MQRTVTTFVVPTLVALNVFSWGFVLLRDDPPRLPASTPPVTPENQLGPDIDALLQRIAALEARRDSSPATTAPNGDSPDGDDSSDVADSSDGEQFAELIDRLTKLETTFADISPYLKVEARLEAIRGDDGYLIADALRDEKKFSSAGEAYLEFLAAHPDHPDARDYWAEARRSFQKAGLTDKALAVQEEILEKFPEHEFQNRSLLAAMSQRAGKMDAAIDHAARAAELATNEQEQLWRWQYWAWYHQIRDGDAAGLAAYREVLGRTERLGLTEHKVGQKLQERIDAIEKRLSR